MSHWHSLPSWQSGMLGLHPWYLPTYPSKAPKSAIDHIFTRTDDKRIEILDRIGIDEKIASDHIPVINKLRIYRNR